MHFSSFLNVILWGRSEVTHSDGSADADLRMSGSHDFTGINFDKFCQSHQAMSPKHKPVLGCRQLRFH